MRFILIIWLCIPILGYTQTKVDSLLARLEEAPEQEFDTIYYWLLKETVNIDPENALTYAKMALKYSEIYANKEIEIRSTYAQGSIFIKKREWDSAEFYLKRARDISYENKIYHRLPWIYGELGLIYNQKSKYDLAIDNYIESIKYSEKFQNKNHVAFLFNEIGIINLQLENYQEAINFFKKAIELKHELNISDGILKNKLNIAICLNDEKKYNEALNILKTISEECRESTACDECKENEFMVNMYSEYGLIHQNKGDYKSAKSFYLKALANIDSASGFLYPRSYGHLADIYFKENKFDSSMYYLNKSNHEANKYDNIRTLIFNKYLLSEIYEKQQNYEEANRQLRSAINLRDNTFPSSMTENIRKSYIDYEKYQSEQIIIAKEKIIKRNNQITFLLALTVLLSITTIILAFKNSKIRKNINEKLSDQVMERTSELNTFLYRTSHDLAGPLARMKGLLRLIGSPKNEEETKQYVDSLNLTAERLEKVIKRLETISRINIRPLQSEKVHLRPFIEAAVEKTKNGFEISPKIEIRGRDYITIDKKLLAGIVENLLENSFNHIDRREQDQKIGIDITNDKNLTITISDTGTGIIEGHEKKIFDLFFTSTDKNERTGIGLYYAKVAVNRLGGKITLERRRKPTIFQIYIPVS